MDEKAIYKACVDKWGVNSQLGMLQEECAELIVAVSKKLRNHPKADDMICEELADVQNMINQFKDRYSNFEKVRLEKLERVSRML